MTAMVIPCCHFIMSASISCIVKINMCEEKNRAITPLLGNMFLIYIYIYISIQKAPRTTWTAKFLTISSMADMRVSSICTCNMIVETTSTFLLVVRFGRAQSHWFIDGSQSDAKRSSSSNRLGLASVSHIQLISHVRVAVKKNIIAAL